MSAALPGVHAMWAGADWTWHKPVKRNDEIRTEAHLKDLIEHQTRFAGRAIQQIYHVDFYNQRATRRRGRQLVLPHRSRPRPRARPVIEPRPDRHRDPASARAMNTQRSVSR
jgi:hypothetical protein